jgi:hypothetical protein
VSHVFKRDKTAVTLPAWSRYRTHLSAVTTLAIILRRTKVILRRMTTVLSSVLGCGFILLGGACHGGKHGHASLRLPGDGSGSFHGHRNGPCDAPTIGAVKSLLSTLPTAAPNGWHSVLASRGGTAREHVLRGCESSLVRVHRTAWKTASRRAFLGPYLLLARVSFKLHRKAHFGPIILMRVGRFIHGVKAETTETRFS